VIVFYHASLIAKVRAAFSDYTVSGIEAAMTVQRRSSLLVLLGWHATSADPRRSPVRCEWNAITRRAMLRNKKGGHRQDPEPCE
jgi:hypothetical protein